MCHEEETVTAGGYILDCLVVILSFFVIVNESVATHLLQFLVSLLLADVLLRQQHLQQLLHGLLGSRHLLLLKLGAADLTAEGVDGQRDAGRVDGVNAAVPAVDRHLRSRHSE